ncbi:putative alpha beta hydrolase fold-3 [Diplodia seriata]|uniref:Putative alpha beta hydrolase fold-3 n=1 Tax=Diplodia seriata TaxID=420778 RepID=A0A0G2E4Z2_9PEZI|nr:putative alpha beta hydrolase fold-3 [Diplodia seriata]
MVLNTITVGAAVTPTVIQTYISHYLNRKPLHGKPTAHLGYHEGLQLVREFLHYAAEHTVEEVQAFTQQWVPVPAWVKTEEVTISSNQLTKAADMLQSQLGPDGIELVGGKTWWQWRRDNAELKAEWIEMRGDYNERKESKDELGSRIMLYIHGGAYYFGSVDEHRYQMQRHARKLKARIFAPRYRLAPQFPFPCGLQDAIAAYLHLLEKHDPSTIVVAGDSAGGGMTLAMLVVLRDQGIPLPAGGILLSPWVDLTHSFPSLSGDGKWDYIPAHGFVHKPSTSWPPPNDDDMDVIKAASKELNAKSGKLKDLAGNPKDLPADQQKDRARGYSIERPREGEEGTLPSTDEIRSNAPPPPPPVLSVNIDGKIITIKDQIQLYAANELITHPLVSPILQPTLGGLPPLLIQVGGGELLCDEQIYIAHKAASPMDHLPDLSKKTPEEQERIREEAQKYPPTDVKLEVWDDLCHVTHTLSFTRPAKLMYRAVAQFSAWALARAQNKPIDILDDDVVSHISSSSESGNDRGATDSSVDTLQKSKEQVQDGAQNAEPKANNGSQESVVGRAGDALPPFKNHMIRQRIDRHGAIRPLEPASELEALRLPASEIGVIKEGPVKKWMGIQGKWAKKYEKEKRAVQKKRIEEFAQGYEEFEGETPPPTALAGRRLKDKDMPKAKIAKGWGLAMWSGWGSKHDQMTIKRETQADGIKEEVVDEGGKGSAERESKSRARSLSTSSKKKSKRSIASGRSRSRRRTITDEGQTDPSVPPSPTLTRDALAAPVTHADDGNSTLAIPAPAKPGTSAASVTATISTRAPEDALSINTAAANSTFSSPLPSPGAGQPTVVISEHAAEGAPPTIIPSTNNSSTRPFRDGIAYPFKLNAGNHKANPSTTTLMSFQDSIRKSMDTSSIAESAATRPEESEREDRDDLHHEEKRMETVEERIVEAQNEDSEKPAAATAAAPERPAAPERFTTAQEF